MNSIQFYKTNEKYGCFSNFSKHTVNYNGFWQTAEHCFQAMKFVGDDFITNGGKIYNCQTAFEAAKLGRSLSPLREDWELVKDETMFEIVLAKFTQHSDIREILLSTTEKNIIEHTANDSYWGDGGDGSGQNKLGIILMKVRTILSKEKVLDKVPPWMKYPLYDPNELSIDMGEIKEYLKNWALWYYGLDINTQKDYREKYNPPENWKDFYSE